MRDPDRIDAVLKVLGEVWREVPDWRLGQLIDNFDITFYTEDDVAVDRLREWLE